MMTTGLLIVNSNYHDGCRLLTKRNNLLITGEKEAE